MKPEPGTYALVLRGRASTEVTVGRWGILRVKPEYYVYVGSAFGPGGVQARVRRHFRKSKRQRWHIDYLRAAAEPICAWCNYASRHLEHEWARAFSQQEGVSCIRGFGSSDCNCDGHLFTMSTEPNGAEVLREFGGILGLCEYRTVA
ncbi:MAG: GIY-YIG nuclease family protein [Rhodothermales bacterium]|nr:GIY-YIG nuclease family protein [Rhodothermales bacterium]